MDRSKKAGKSCQILTPPSSQIIRFRKIIGQEKAARFSPLLPRCLQPAPLQPLDSPPLPENNGINISSDVCNFPAELLSNLLWLSSSLRVASALRGWRRLEPGPTSPLLPYVIMMAIVLWLVFSWLAKKHKQKTIYVNVAQCD